METLQLREQVLLPEQVQPNAEQKQFDKGHKVMPQELTNTELSYGIDLLSAALGLNPDLISLESIARTPNDSVAGIYYYNSEKYLFIKRTDSNGDALVWSLPISDVGLAGWIADILSNALKDIGYEEWQIESERIFSPTYGFTKKGNLAGTFSIDGQYPYTYLYNFETEEFISAPDRGLYTEEAITNELTEKIMLALGYSEEDVLSSREG